MKQENIMHNIAAMQDRLAGTPDFDVEVKYDESGIIRVFSKNYPNTSATFDLERNRVTADSGSRPGAGALNELLNNDTLLKNATYIVDGHLYVKTDALGRPYLFRVNYNRSWSIDHDSRPSRKLGKEAMDSDQAGHVIAAALHGPHERFNIVPMPWQYNEKWCRFQEQMLGGALKELEKFSEDWFMDLRIDVSYDGPSLRPDAIHLDAEIDNACGYSAKLSSKCVY